MNQAAARWLHRLRQVTLAEIWLVAEAQIVLLYCQLVRWRRPVGGLLGIEPVRWPLAISWASIPCIMQILAKP